MTTPTNNPVPSSDPRDLLFNAEVLDVAINSSASEYKDRLGIPRLTLAGAAESIKAFNSRGAWAAATLYAVRDLVLESGTWYVCVAAHTSSGSFAADVSAKWRVHQGLTKTDLADANGSNLSGHIELGSDAAATTTQAALRELSANSPSAAIPNFGAVGNRNTTILGDSISHGAFALNTFMHGWVRVFARMINAELGARSYGFVNLLSLGTGGTLTSDIHTVNFYGAAWGSVEAATDAGAAGYPAGMALRPGDGTSTASIVVPSFQTRALIYYGKRAGSLPFNVSVNGSAVATVATDAASGFGTQEITLTDDGYGNCTIGISATSGAYANQPDIIGISYLSSAAEPVVNNFSTSGRRLRFLGQSMITALMQESSTAIIALGHNDQGDADSDATYWAEFQTRIGWIKDAAKLYGVKLIVPDFCWTALPSSRTRKALRQLAADTRGIYIDLPGLIFKNRESLNSSQRASYLVSTLAMWSDSSHPNKAGHQWIAETIAKRIGLSCSSKNEAIRFHDWWMPLALKASTEVFNFFTGALVSSFKRNGSEILVRLYVRKSGAGSFPAGAFVIQDAWPARSEIDASQGYTGVGVVRIDTGAIVSVIGAAANGQFTLKVTDGTWVTQQQLSFSMQAG